MYALGRLVCWFMQANRATHLVLTFVLIASASTLVYRLAYGRREPVIDSGGQTQPATSASGPQTQNVIPSNVQHATFHIFKSETDGQTTYIVPLNTTDEQLRGLLWYFRQKVRGGDFKAIGITRPTAKQWGKYGYKSGMLVVYRGVKCANEGYAAEKGILGACGYGEHDDAYYQWGIEADPNKDEARIGEKSGNPTSLFDYKDNWHPSLEVLKKPDQKMKDVWAAEQQAWEPMQRSAVLITNILNRKGINVSASANENQPKQLDLQSPIFKDTASREAFVRDGLPQIQTDLCHVGFKTIRILQDIKSDAGESYSLHCP
jgi:hypothetical protein